MKLGGLLALVAVLTGMLSTSDHAAAPPIAWQRIVEAAAWPARDNAGAVSFNGSIWLLGGWFGSYKETPRDVWRSTDGKKWTEVTAQAPWKHGGATMPAVFGGRIFVMGGWDRGRLPGATASNQVWSSADGVDWQLVTPSAEWPARVAGAVVEFKGKLWLMGGVADVSGDPTRLYNDVWSSDDGKRWQLVTASAPWSPRAFHSAVVFRDRMWIISGGNWQAGDVDLKNDVWSSADGVTWTQSAAPPWSARIWAAAAVYQEKLWVVGGYTEKEGEANAGRNLSDVWFSSDGEHWQQAEGEFPPRHAHNLLTHGDKLLMLGGLDMALYSDVWVLGQAGRH